MKFFGTANVNEQVVRANMQVREGLDLDDTLIDQDIRSLYKTGLFEFIEVKRDEESQLILNNLYKFTQMQESFHMILLSIVAGQPRELGIIPLIKLFIEHRVEVVRRRADVAEPDDPTPLLELNSQFFVAILLMFGGWRVFHRQMEVGDLITFFLLSNQFFAPIALGHTSLVLPISGSSLPTSLPSSVIPLTQFTDLANRHAFRNCPVTRSSIKT